MISDRIRDTRGRDEVGPVGPGIFVFGSPLAAAQMKAETAILLIERIGSIVLLTGTVRNANNGGRRGTKRGPIQSARSPSQPLPQLGGCPLFRP